MKLVVCILSVLLAMVAAIPVVELESRCVACSCVFGQPAGCQFTRCVHGAKQEVCNTGCVSSSINISDPKLGKVEAHGIAATSKFFVPF